MSEGIVQRREMRHAVNRLINAEIAKSWKPAQARECHFQIEQELEAAREQFEKLLKTVIPKQ